ncbi:FAD-dependent oxidoreductase [Roseimicrobium sp. ORNL1]|uniref:FAD-dependent oxidoreductase n=1 Tax=Roseimicrobium sp. ORNL1 TaxID=2711231 RepID=UPI0013E0FA80|nr:FAD-dependent oxidoreductase [Roseimicrobium sp. ORNL1]QIF05317.1 FAD-dependent oxidoreductase [Roseimicrobium sp. ORNL1]
MKKKHPILTLCLAAATAGAFGAAAPLAHAAPANLFVEAESFQDQGGWVLDTQFIDAMGSPYLMAHGLGKPVKDAFTTVKNATAGKYRVWIRTKNWVGPWDAPGAPGRFQVSVNGKSLGKDFGTQGKDWLWEDGGEVELPAGETKLSIQDQTGFNGRVDAILFTSDLKFTPPSEKKALASFRHKSLGLPDEAPATKEYDLVVVGGGYAGMGAAISGARQGLSVALVQNRPVLGGNGSSEVQVWAQGGTRRGLYPHLGEIVEEFTDRASNSPGFVEEYGDKLKEQVVRDEKSIDLYLNNHVWKVEMAKGKDKKIVGAIALNTKTGEEKNIRGKFFVDSTGHGNLGALANAAYTMLEKGHLGMSNMWVVSKTDKAQDWPETPWALDLEPDKDFPTPKVFKPLKNNVIGANKPAPDLSHFKVSDFLHGEWFWESGFDKHPIEELEIVRDWNLRALFGAFSGLRKKDPAKYADYAFQWVAYVGGTRESRLLTGDVVLNEDDIVSGKQFPDGCVPTTWDIDLHYPKEQYMTKYKDNPFISRAAFGKGVDRKNGYPIPYRSFYSKNIDNLFMAGRCISVDHSALGTIRVMRTCGMMGEVVGKAAYLTVRHETTPRGVYEQYLDNLKDLMTKPGAMRRDSIEGQLYMPANAAKLPELVEDSINPAKLEGLVIDDEDAELTGSWTKGEGLKPHVNKGYSYTGAAGASARFPFSVKETGTYEVRIAWQPHQNRGTTVPVSVLSADGQKDFTVDQSKPADLKLGFHSLGKFKFEAGAEAAVTFRTEGAKGNVHLDAVQVLPAK